MKLFDIERIFKFIFSFRSRIKINKIIYITQK